MPPTKQLLRMQLPSPCHIRYPNSRRLWKNGRYAPLTINVLPARKRGRRKPKRYDRPVPGGRVQMDTCKGRPDLYQFTVIDDCGRFLVASLARRGSAHATLRFLDQVLEEMPFPIQRLQTDRGTDFFC
jgi:hypothetical protein